jgi:hypothetical protein
MRIQNTLFFLIILVFLAGCGTSPNNSTPEFVMPTPRPPMTLAPTYTPESTQGPLPTITPPPTREAQQ